ncbi:MAG: hypothetical protein ACFFB5_14335 [Promethearchaeota archaeon]
MIQSIKILRPNQKIKLVLLFCSLGFSSLLFAIFLNVFKIGFIFSVLCWMITGVIESSYNQKELENPVLSFSPQNFIVMSSVGIVIISLFTILLFLH